MKRRAILTLALIVACAPSVTAAPDAQGDQEFATGAWQAGQDPSWGPAPDGWYDEFDLLELTSTQHDEVVAFLVDFAAAWPGPGPRADGAPEVTGGFAVRFTYGGVDYAVNASELHVGGVAELQVMRGASVSSVGQVHLESVGKSWRVELPYAWIRSSLDEPWFYGERLTNVHIWTHGWSAYAGPSGSQMAACYEQGPLEDQVRACGAKVRDRMPDTGFLGAIERVRPDNAPLLDVHVPHPARGSNGQATTHVFPFFIQNNAPGQDTLTLRVAQKPDDWTIRVRDTVVLDAGEAAQLVATVQVPFRHVHGVEETATLEVDGSYADAEFELGVRYLAVPQPSGHHPELFFHAAESQSREAWMNTLQQDVAAEPGASIIPGYEGLDPVGLSYTATFAINLEPDLVLGLDADMDRVGTLTLDLGVAVDADYRFEGELLGATQEAGSWTVAELFAIDPAQVDASGLVDIALHPRPAADLFDVAEAGLLRLSLIATAALDPLQYADAVAAQQSGAPILQIGTEDSIMTLPLVDYAQPVPPMGLLDAIALDPKGSPTKEARAGQAVAFTFGVDAHSMDRVDVDVVAPEDVDTVLSQGRLEAPWPREATIAVRVPADAQVGQEISVVVIVAPSNGAPIESSLVYAIAVVDDAPEDAAAEALIEGGGKTTPALAPGLILLMLVARRRRP